MVHIEADAIVSSVNTYLMMGGGGMKGFPIFLQKVMIFLVDGYTRSNAGGKMETELDIYGSVDIGSCVITRGISRTVDLYLLIRLVSNL